MKHFRHLVKPYLVWSVMIIAIPLFLIGLYAFTEEGNSVLTLTFTFDNFRKFAEATYLNVIINIPYLG